QASIIRNEEGLGQALSQLDELSGQFSPAVCLRRGDPPDQVAQARNGLQLGTLIVQAMLRRRESRGAHFRSDYPFVDQERFGQVIIQKK
ncbi:MAG TPA: hypothetical protein DD640_10745, partial [Clostridiales bacterium]|nr:hypothetical protein [Clostridiales bacterium]